MKITRVTFSNAVRLPNRNEPVFSIKDEATDFGINDNGSLVMFFIDDIAIGVPYSNVNYIWLEKVDE